MKDKEIGHGQQLFWVACFE